MILRRRIYVFLLLASCLSASCRAAEPDGYSIKPRTQRFICNIGYTVEECRRQSAIVHRIVAQYRGEELGDWTWILVRAEDWKDLVRRLHLNADSPAFTSLDFRETFLEESLVSPRPGRARELMDAFGIPLDQLLDVAVTHELAHAVCHGGTEFMAEEFGRRLRAGLHPSCAELYP